MCERKRNILFSPQWKAKLKNAQWNHDETKNICCLYVEMKGKRKGWSAGKKKGKEYTLVIDFQPFSTGFPMETCFTGLESEHLVFCEFEIEVWGLVMFSAASREKNWSWRFVWVYLYSQYVYFRFVIFLSIKV